MATFMVRRLANHAALAVLAASLGYLLAAAALDPRAGLEDRAPRPPESVIDARLGALNLDDRTPLTERYLTWAGGVAHGDLGRTFDGEPVDAELWRRLGVSLRLVVPGAVLGGVMGVALGAHAAIRHGRAADRLISGGSSLLLAVPVFVLAVLLQIVAGEANDALGMRVFVWVGESAPEASRGALWDLVDRGRRLLLPTATIALGQLAFHARYQRGLMLDVLHADHVRAARARGLRRRDALLRHGLRIALVPMTAYLAYTTGLVLLGGVFTETAFGRHGLGEWLVDSISRGDVNAVAAIEGLAACAVLLAALASDVLAAALDPRVRAGGMP
ncbi:ABC transporter permease [Actinomadura luteofluorescens]|uniref:ABC transporter permease n=1 Tax=Actinomadura luteofluorescens TaxID=46163 RepID=UPI0021648314|nr:ABC transporter permease [Actinomadura glauciflava]MCR3737746.1 peptide/nickel transport system permease protein [Actinomadura glauciflava]